MVLMAQRSNQLHEQHRHTHRDVEAVKACQHEERGTINSRVQRQPEQRVGLIVFRRLQEQEDDTEGYGHTKPRIKFLDLILSKASVRKLTGHAR